MFPYIGKNHHPSCYEVISFRGTGIPPSQLIGFFGKITGQIHISWENLAGFRFRFSHPIHWSWENPPGRARNSYGFFPLSSDPRGSLPPDPRNIAAERQAVSSWPEMQKRPLLDRMWIWRRLMKAAANIQVGSMMLYDARWCFMNLWKVLYDVVWVYLILNDDYMCMSFRNHLHWYVKDQRSHHIGVGPSTATKLETSRGAGLHIAFFD